MSAGLLRRSWCILEKDLRLEWRSREVVYSAAFFALIVALVFAFGVLEQGLRARMASAALWVCLLFAGSNALQRSFEREREGRVLRALLLTGRIGWPLFIAKVASNFLFLSLVLGLAAPLGFVLLGAAVPERPWAFAASLLLGAAAFATVGTLVSAMVGELRLRALLFPVVLFPLMIPIFVLGVSASSAFMFDDSPRRAQLRIAAGAQSIWLELDGQRFEASGEQALAQLQRELSATAQTQPQWGVQSVLLGEALVLTPTRGALPELSSEGLELSYHHSESEAPAYLLIMLTLVLLLLPLCGWLFGVLLEPS